MIATVAVKATDGSTAMTSSTQSFSVSVDTPTKSVVTVPPDVTKPKSASTTPVTSGANVAVKAIRLNADTPLSLALPLHETVAASRVTDTAALLTWVNSLQAPTFSAIGPSEMVCDTAKPPVTVTVYKYSVALFAVSVEVPVVRDPAFRLKSVSRLARLYPPFSDTSESKVIVNTTVAVLARSALEMTGVGGSYVKPNAPDGELGAITAPVNSLMLTPTAGVSPWAPRVSWTVQLSSKCVGTAELNTRAMPSVSLAPAVEESGMTEAPIGVRHPTAELAPEE